MAESPIPNTGDPRVDAALERIRGKFPDLEDAIIVQAHLEKTRSARAKEHADLLASHQDFMKSEDDAMKVHTQKMAEFDEKLKALIDIVSKMQGGMESRPS